MRLQRNKVLSNYRCDCGLYAAGSLEKCYILHDYIELREFLQLQRRSGGPYIMETVQSLGL